MQCPRQSSRRSLPHFARSAGALNRYRRLRNFDALSGDSQHSFARKIGSVGGGHELRNGAPDPLDAVGNVIHGALLVTFHGSPKPAQRLEKIHFRLPPESSKKLVLPSSHKLLPSV